MTEQIPTEIDLAQAAAAEHFYSGALHRIGHFMAVLSPLLAAAACGSSACVLPWASSRLWHCLR